jgi:hypothetical protein
MPFVTYIALLPLVLAAPSATRPAGRELTDRPLSEEQARKYRLALLEAQKSKDLETLRAIEEGLDKADAAWKKAQAEAVEKRRAQNRSSRSSAAAKAKSNADRLDARDAAKDRHEETAKTYGAARKAVLALRQGMSQSAQSAIHFEYGQEKKAIAASNSAMTSFVTAMQTWPKDKGSGTSAHITLLIQDRSFRSALDSAVGLHLTGLFERADRDAWLAATAWLSVDRSVRTFLPERKPDIFSKHQKALDLIARSLPKLADQDLPKLQESILYWAEYMTPKPVTPAEPRF